MTYTISERTTTFASRTRILVLSLIAALFCVTAQPAHAQSSNTWKSIAIIGGTTAAGAYIGHKIGGSTGTLIGAGIGAAGGYAIDKHRRDNQYNNDYNPYANNGYYGNNNGYYDQGNGGYYGNGNNRSYPNGGYYPNNGGYSNNGRCDRNTARNNPERNPNDYYRGSDGMYYPRH